MNALSNHVVPGSALLAPLFLLSASLFGAYELKAGRLSLSLLTFNLCATCERHDERMAQVVGKIRELNPDVIAFQEVSQLTGLRKNPLEGVLASGWYRYRWGATGKLLGGPGKSGLAILSRFPILDHKVVLLPHGDSMLLGAVSMRYALLKVKLETPLGPLQVQTTHLIADPPGSVKRQEQLLEIVREIERGLSENPQVFMGDLNILEGDRLSRFLSGETRLAGDGVSWTDAFRKVHSPRVPGYTWDRKNALIHPGAWPEWPSCRVDRIYIVPGTANRAEVLECALVLDKPDEEGLYPSDHFAVFSKIEIAPAPAPAPAAR